MFKKTGPKNIHFPGPLVLKVTTEFPPASVPPASLSAQNRPFAFFRFTCFQAGRALYSSLVMSSANSKSSSVR